RAVCATLSTPLPGPSSGPVCRPSAVRSQRVAPALILSRRWPTHRGRCASAMPDRWRTHAFSDTLPLAAVRSTFDRCARDPAARLSRQGTDPPGLVRELDL